MKTHISPNQPQFEQLLGNFLEAGMVYLLSSSNLGQDTSLEKLTPILKKIQKIVVHHFEQVSSDPEKIVLFFLSLKSLTQAIYRSNKMGLSSHSAKSMVKLLEKFFVETCNYYNSILSNTPKVFENMVLDLKEHLRDKAPLYPHILPQKSQDHQDHQDQPPVKIVLRAPLDLNDVG